ncbi:MAG: dTMP kinase [Candidatus Omnitrophica bacterium]|nr:dTMP kinase [Candidatus Omnitrophota bacterium]
MGKSLKKGYLITFEGAEGSGKSTQIRFASRLLKKRGYSVVILREPGGTATSEAIRRILLDKTLKEMEVETELLLYLAARAQLVRERIEPALKKGKVVILDRYEDSTLAYQSFGGGIPLRAIEPFNRFVRGGSIPYLTFLLDVDTKQGLKRSGRNDRIEKKSLSFHKRVRRGFLTLAKRNARRFVILSSKESIKEVQKKIMKVLDARF